MSQLADAPICASIVEQASHWLMLHWDGALKPAEHAAFLAWQAADPEHGRAWQRLGQLQNTLAAVPSRTARAVLRDAPDRRRRDTLKLLGVLLLTGGGGYLASEQLPWRESLADMRTGAGEICRQQLADGSSLVLNSGSAVDIRFNQHERRIRLYAGELLLTSGPHASAAAPLIVQTAAGDIQAHGSRFDVREIAGGSRIELYDGGVDISPRHAGHQSLAMGQGLWFNADQIGPIRPANRNAAAWSDGRLIAERQPLGHFLDELQRYRPGVIQCDPQVAGLLLTGVFPLGDSDRVLATLQQTLPVTVRYRTRFWVSVSGRV